MRKTVQLLRFDADAKLQSGDFAGAARSVRGALNAARSFGDEPGALPQLVRIAGVAVVSKSVPRLLAQGDPDEKDLEMLQKEFGAKSDILTGRWRGAGSGPCNKFPCRRW